MKIIFPIIIILLILARLNLPPSENLNDFLSEQPKANLLEKLSTSLLFSQNVADWTYRDFIIVKFACSDRLEVELIAIPFKKWKIYRKNINNCGNYSA